MPEGIFQRGMQRGNAEMTFEQTEINQLKARIAALEDFNQRLSQVIIAAPTPQPKPTPPPVNGETCPKCGGKKKPDFKLCYKCHLAEEALTQ